MLIVGIDLSLTGTGIAYIEIQDPPTFDPQTRVACETITSTGSRTDTLTQRITRRRKIRNTIGHRISAADLIVIEGPSYGSQGAGTWDRAGLWASVVDMIDHLQIPFIDVPPTKLKKFAADKGNADKTQVSAGLARLWGDLATPADNNQWDALGLATMGAVHLARRQLPIRVLERHQEVVAGVTWPTVPVSVARG